MPKPYQPRDYRAEHEKRQAMLDAYRAAKAALLNTKH